MEKRFPPDLYADGRWYDRLLAGEGDEAVTAFHVKRVSVEKAAVLVLACGTGRVAVPLAEAGHGVVGVDLSAGMLQEAQQRAASANVDVDWRRGDMRDFAVDRRFDHIVVAGNSLAHLHTPDELRACLACVRRHLAPGGRLVLDGYVPDVRLLARDGGQRYPFGRIEAPDGSGPVEVSQSARYDPATQLHHWTLHLRRPASGGAAELPITLRMWFPQELEAVVTGAGFVLDERYGGHDGRRFDHRSGKQILVCS